MWTGCVSACLWGTGCALPRLQFCKESQWIEKLREGGGRQPQAAAAEGRTAPGELAMEHRKDVDSF